MLSDFLSTTFRYLTTDASSRQVAGRDIMRRNRAILALMLSLAACATPPADTSSLRALNPVEVRVSVAQNRAQVLARRDLSHETVFLTADAAGRIGYARFGARTTEPGRAELVELGAQSFAPDYGADGIIVLDDGQTNDWLAFFVDPQAHATRLHIAFEGREVINEALSFDCAIVADKQFGEGTADASVTALAIDGRPVHTSVLRYDAAGKQWRMSSD